MTPAPVVEALLVVLAGVMGAWVLSYLLHSTLLIGAAALLSRVTRWAAIDRVRLWRLVIVAPFFTATVQMVVGGPSWLSVEIGRLMPQALVDWRFGIVGMSLLVIAAAALIVGGVAGALVLRRVFGHRRPAPAALRDEVASLAVVVGCRPPKVTVSDTSPVPAAIGLAEVCVPAHSIDAMSSDERRSLLAHEVGHLVARDPLWFALAGNLARLAAFQPLNRYAVGRLRVVSEEAADDFSVRATGDPVALARGLAGLAALLLVLPGGVAATGSPIVSRVSRLLDDHPAPAPCHPAVHRIAIACTLAVMVAFAPGVTASPEAVANRLSWLAPSKDDPNARMLEVRRFERELRDTLRRTFR